MNLGGSAGESELEHKWRWLVAEEERLVELRTAMQWQSEELEERQSVLEKREMALDRSHPASDVEGGRQTSASSGARRKNLNGSTDDKVCFKLINNSFMILCACVYMTDDSDINSLPV